MDQVWKIMPFYDLLPMPIDNNVLNLLDRIHIPSRYVSWGWLGFFVVIFRQVSNSRSICALGLLGSGIGSCGTGLGSKGGCNPSEIPRPNICLCADVNK